MTLSHPEAFQQRQEAIPPGSPAAAQAANPEPDDASLVYHIGFDRLESRLNRSAATLLASRLDQDSPSRALPLHELGSTQELLDEIAEYADEADDFIHSHMPIQEIVFRMLLARRNQPTALSELHYELTERWSTPVRPINLSLSDLRRILDGDNYYGFDRTEG